MWGAHLEDDGPVLRFTVLLEQKLQPLFGDAGLPATEQTSACRYGTTSTLCERRHSGAQSHHGYGLIRHTQLTEHVD